MSEAWWRRLESTGFSLGLSTRQLLTLGLGLPGKPNPVRFLAATTVLLQGALAICVHDPGAESMVNEVTVIFHCKCLLKKRFNS